MADVFISYASQDRDRTRLFAQAFEAEGLTVWWDSALRSGEAYDQKIEAALRSAKAVVVLWSGASVESRWVRAEATLADRNRTLVPVMIEACERPIMFELTQTTDLSHWDGDVDDKAWKILLKDVRQLAGGVGPAVQARDAVPAAPGKRGGRASLAILPFSNRSAEREDDIFATGMVEDVIAALSISKSVGVIAASATAVYRKNVSDLRSIGRELGARYILEGNVRRIGEDLRVTTQLVEAETAAILWTQKFDRPLKELAWLQEELVTELAAHMGVQVLQAETERALKKPGDLTAWEALMRGWAAYGRYSPDSLRAGIAEMRRAVSIAPDYATAYSSLAQALANSYQGGHDQGDPVVAKEAYACAQRALKLDSNNPNVLFQCASAIGLVGRRSEGQPLAERAVELNPNNADARSVLGMYHMYADRNDEALAQFKAELTLAPRGRNTFICFANSALSYYQAGRFEAALQDIDRSLALYMGNGFTWRFKAIFCQAAGLQEQACDALRHSRAIDPALTLEQWQDRMAHAWAAEVHQPKMFEQMQAVWDATPLEEADC